MRLSFIFSARQVRRFGAKISNRSAVIFHDGWIGLGFPGISACHSVRSPCISVRTTSLPISAGIVRFACLGDFPREVVVGCRSPQSPRG